MEKIAEINNPDLKSSTSTTFKWENPLDNLALNSGCIHIWKVKIDQTISLLDLRQYLSTEERLRADRIIIPEKRVTFQFARSALRKILSLYTDQLPGSIEFGYRASGKPYLLQFGKASSIIFNISHSEELVVVALTKNRCLGIDLEYIHQIKSKDGAVKQYFSINDQAFFRNLPESQKEIAFFHAWTKIEAFGKAIGSGLSCKIQQDYFNESLNKSLPINKYAISQEKGFWYLRFSPDTNYTAVTAIQSIEKPNLFFFNYPSYVYDDTN